MQSTSSEFLQNFIYTKCENNSLQFMVLPSLSLHLQHKLTRMLGQDMNMKMVEGLKNTGDLFINVIENVQCVLNSSVPSPSLLHSSPKSSTARLREQSSAKTSSTVTLASTSSSTPLLLKETSLLKLPVLCMWTT